MIKVANIVGNFNHSDCVPLNPFRIANCGLRIWCFARREWVDSSEFREANSDCKLDIPRSAIRNLSRLTYLLLVTINHEDSAPHE